MGDKDKGLSGTDNINGNFLNATEGEQNWAIRSGAEPFDAHILKKLGFEQADAIANEFFHGGVAAFGNHLYLEFGTVDDEGNFETQRRIHSFTVAPDDNGGTIVATENNGTIFTLAAGGVIPFSEDPIYVMDPHETKTGQLQSADDDFLFGEGPTAIALDNLTQREAMGLYNLALKGAIDYNSREIEVDGATINGNTIHAGLKKMLDDATETPLNKHDPSGWDAGADPEALERPKHELSEYPTLKEQEEAIAQNEQALAEQWKPYRDSAVNVDLVNKPEPPTGSAPSN